MEENDSNDSTGPLMARFYAATPVPVSLVRVLFLEKIADVYLLIAPALTWRGRISQLRVNSKQFSSFINICSIVAFLSIRDLSTGKVLANKSN